MDFINFYTLIYFIRDYLRGAINRYRKGSIIASDIDIAIAYYSKSPDALYSAIVSSDISLLRTHAAQHTLKEYIVLLRNVSQALEKSITLTGYIDANHCQVYLREFLLRSLDEDLSSSLQSFFTHSRRFLSNHKQLTTKDTNYRLTISLVANVIHLQQLFSSIQKGNE